MEEGISAITCRNCGRITHYPEMASPPLICPHCQQALQPIRSPDLALRNTEKPAAPAPQPKRAGGIFSRRFGAVMMLCVMILVTVGGILLLIIDHLDKQDRYQRLMNNGRTVSATIINLRDVSSDSDTYYKVTYRFQPAENNQPPSVTQEQNVTKQLYATLKRGQAIDVIYEVPNPSNNSIKSETRPPEGGWLVYYIVMLAVFGGGLIFGISYDLAKARS